MLCACLLLGSMALAAPTAPAPPAQGKKVTLLVTVGEPTKEALELLKPSKTNLEERVKAAKFLFSEIGDNHEPLAVQESIFGLALIEENAMMLHAVAQADISTGVLDVMSLPLPARVALDAEYADLSPDQAGTLLKPGVKVGVYEFVQMLVDVDRGRLFLYAFVIPDPPPSLPVIARRPPSKGAAPERRWSDWLDHVRLTFSEDAKGSDVYRSELCAQAMRQVADYYARIDEYWTAARWEVADKLRPLLGPRLGNGRIRKGDSYAGLTEELRHVLEHCLDRQYKKLGYANEEACRKALKDGRISDVQVQTYFSIKTSLGDGKEPSELGLPLGPPINVLGGF